MNGLTKVKIDPFITKGKSEIEKILIDNDFDLSRKIIKYENPLDRTIIYEQDLYCLDY